MKVRGYNTITNTCTTNIVRHVNEVYPGRVPRALAILLPGLSPKILQRNNLVRMNGTIEETLQRSIIDERAKSWMEILTSETTREHAQYEHSTE